MFMTDIATAQSLKGFAHKPFEQVASLLEENLARGRDLGASVCITQKGETVVDLWGGYMDQARTMPWQRDTLVNVYSCTKPMTALVALWACDQGLLDFNESVARYWPEFAANGKEHVLVRHVMSHSAGLPDWAIPIDVADLYDWDMVTSRLADQALAWIPGTESGYHALTQGYLIGEIIRRITGRTIGTVFKQEIAEPLGADFHIGLPPSEDARVAELALDPEYLDNEAARAMMIGPMDISLPATTAWRRAEIPAAGGIGNARSLAQIQALLANRGAVAGKRILSEEACTLVLEPQVQGIDRVLDMDISFGLGFALGEGMMPNPNTVYWGGYGGSLVIVDMDAETTFAYAMNQMVPAIAGDSRAFDLALAMWGGMGLL
jgi:CubicO group peptidase (beta-lactamase class C family)